MSVRLVTLSHVEWELSTTSHICWIGTFYIGHRGMIDFYGCCIGVRVRKVDQVFEKPLIVLGLVAYASEFLGLTSHCACRFLDCILHLLLCHFLSGWTVPDLMRVVVYTLGAGSGQSRLIIRMLDGRVISSSI